MRYRQAELLAARVLLQEEDKINVRYVVIVGTGHSYQIPPAGPTANEFRAFLGEICNAHRVQAIAEELSQEALGTWNVASSLCHALAIATGLLHRYCDLVSRALAVAKGGAEPPIAQRRPFRGGGSIPTETFDA